MAITIIPNTRKGDIAVCVVPAESVTCPSCKGKGESMGFVCGTRCDYRAMKCFTCGGSGAVSQEQIRLMELAELVRKDRIARRLSIREEGKRLNVDFAEWSRIEGGRKPETQSGARALATRYQELGIDAAALNAPEARNGDK